ncbi:hypothetical protein K7711_11985 [Nocardia sp. CA2R105]|uniref:hypothetical protein n=1 Tax=Nocardia coffeae TaxID=2873381 RepID=UPI001CA774D1|nr:hypothetical protein [Nocardia coffeae]MBY8857200.1 hypothetical protein [Nocardia coffeae]
MEFARGTELGVDISITPLRTEFDAVVLACGATQPRDAADELGRALSELPAVVPEHGRPPDSATDRLRVVPAFGRNVTGIVTDLPRAPAR